MGGEHGGDRFLAGCGVTQQFSATGLHQERGADPGLHHCLHSGGLHDDGGDEGTEAWWQVRKAVLRQWW